MVEEQKNIIDWQDSEIRRLKKSLKKERQQVEYLTNHLDVLTKTQQESIDHLLQNVEYGGKYVELHE